MLTIRLTRKGKKNQPFFRVVVTDKKNPPRAGRAVEDLGFVDPLKKRKSLNKERILYWISKGAKPSDSMHNLLISEKIIEAKKIHVSKLSKKKQAEIAKTEADKKVKAEAEEAEKEKQKAEELAKKAEAEKPAETLSEAPKEEKPAEEAKSEEKPEEPKKEESDKE